MAKKRTFTFYDGEETKTVEALSYRKAVKSFQNDTICLFYKSNFDCDLFRTTF